MRSPRAAAMIASASATGQARTLPASRTSAGEMVPWSRISRRAGRCRPGRGCDDLRLVGLKLTFLIASRAVSLLRLSRRESWWKDAEILILRHQLSVAPREQPRAHSRLTWPDRAWLALLSGTLPVERRPVRAPAGAP